MNAPKNLTICYKEAEGSNTLIYSLLCVVNMETILKNNSVGDVMHYMTNKHPNAKRMNLRPLVIETIKSVNGDPVIFAFFIPTKEKNPNSSRVLLPASFIAQYRQDNLAMIEFNDDIVSWQAMLDFYLKPQ